MNDGLALYQDAIKQMAGAAHGQGALAAPDGEVRLDNPLCGDRVTLQVALEDGHVAALAHETRGCLLCRAAASLLGLRAAGLDAAGAAAATAAVERVLREGATAPGDWPELEMFAPARAYPSRHRCVLLPFQALRDAIGRAGAAR